MPYICCNAVPLSNATIRSFVLVAAESGADSQVLVDTSMLLLEMTLASGTPNAKP